MKWFGSWIWFCRLSAFDFYLVDVVFMVDFWELF